MTHGLLSKCIISQGIGIACLNVMFFHCRCWFPDSCFFQNPPTPRARGSAPRRLDSHFVLVAFECFGPVPPRDIANGFACWRGISRAIELFFFMDSKGTVRRVFLACVLHALGSNPAGVRVFRNCAPKGHLPMVLLAGEASHGR